ncbi:MAG: YIP1 family protein [Acidobacteriota bacterium]
MNANVEDSSRRSIWAFSGMLLNPLRTLESLGAHPRWLLPILCASLAAGIVNYYLVERVGLGRLIAVVARSNEAIDPDAVLQQALANKTQIILIQAFSSVFGVVVAALLIALVLWLIVLVVGADATYRHVLALVAHVTFLTTIVRQSMLAMAITARNSWDGFDLTNPLATNLGYFLRPESIAVSRILDSIDLISLAGIWLLIVGLLRISRSLSRSTAIGVVVVPWILYVAVRAWSPWLK